MAQRITSPYEVECFGSFDRGEGCCHFCYFLLDCVRATPGYKVTAAQEEKKGFGYIFSA